MSDCISCDG